MSGNITRTTVSSQANPLSENSAKKVTAELSRLSNSSIIQSDKKASTTVATARETFTSMREAYTSQHLANIQPRQDDTEQLVAQHTKELAAIIDRLTAATEKLEPLYAKVKELQESGDLFNLSEADAALIEQFGEAIDQCTLAMMDLEKCTQSMAALEKTLSPYQAQHSSGILATASDYFLSACQKVNTLARSIPFLGKTAIALHFSSIFASAATPPGNTNSLTYGAAEDAMLAVYNFIVGWGFNLEKTGIDAFLRQMATSLQAPINADGTTIAQALGDGTAAYLNEAGDTLNREGTLNFLQDAAERIADGVTRGVFSTNDIQEILKQIFTGAGDWLATPSGRDTINVLTDSFNVVVQNIFKEVDAVLPKAVAYGLLFVVLLPTALRAGLFLTRIGGQGLNLVGQMASQAVQGALRQANSDNGREIKSAAQKAAEGFIEGANSAPGAMTNILQNATQGILNAITSPANKLHIKDLTRDICGQAVLGALSSLKEPLTSQNVTHVLSNLKTFFETTMADTQGSQKFRAEAEKFFASLLKNGTQVTIETLVGVVGDALQKAVTDQRVKGLITAIMQSAKPAYEKIKAMIELTGKTIQKIVSTPDSWIMPESTLGIQGWEWFAELATSAAQSKTTLGDAAPVAKDDPESKAAIARTKAALEKLDELAATTKEALQKEHDQQIAEEKANILRQKEREIKQAESDIQAAGIEYDTSNVIAQQHQNDHGAQFQLAVDDTYHQLTQASLAVRQQELVLLKAQQKTNPQQDKIKQVKIALIRAEIDETQKVIQFTEAKLAFLQNQSDSARTQIEQTELTVAIAQENACLSSTRIHKDILTLKLQILLAQPTDDTKQFKTNLKQAEIASRVQEAKSNVAIAQAEYDLLLLRPESAADPREKTKMQIAAQTTLRTAKEELAAVQQQAQQAQQAQAETSTDEDDEEVFFESSLPDYSKINTAVETIKTAITEAGNAEALAKLMVGAHDLGAKNIVLRASSAIGRAVAETPGAPATIGFAIVDATFGTTLGDAPGTPKTQWLHTRVMNSARAYLPAARNLPVIGHFLPK